jgi:hypothetical protein
MNDDKNQNCQGFKTPFIEKTLILSWQYCGNEKPWHRYSLCVCKANTKLYIFYVFLISICLLAVNKTAKLPLNDVTHRNLSGLYSCSSFYKMHNAVHSWQKKNFRVC